MAKFDFYTQKFTYNDLRKQFEDHLEAEDAAIAKVTGEKTQMKRDGYYTFHSSWTQFGFSKHQLIFDSSDTAMFLFHVENIQYLIEDELNTINDGNKDKALEQFKKDMMVLVNTFKDKVTTEKGGYPIDQSILLNFKNDTNALFDKYSRHIESQKSWAPAIKNILLLLSVIGTIPAIISLSYKASKGTYLFFDQRSVDTTKLDKALPSEEAPLSIK